MAVTRGFHWVRPRFFLVSWAEKKKAEGFPGAVRGRKAEEGFQGAGGLAGRFGRKRPARGPSFRPRDNACGQKTESCLAAPPLGRPAFGLEGAHGLDGLVDQFVQIPA
jgi:hypothetical protein